jgi:hypothetical protein
MIKTFFATLANAPREVVQNKGFLNEFYHRYQSAMHATRAAVYNAPYLNAPTLRQRKIDILADDDAIGGISHHKHLESIPLPLYVHHPFSSMVHCNYFVSCMINRYVP